MKPRLMCSTTLSASTIRNVGTTHRISESRGVRNAGGISLGACQQNRVQAIVPQLMKNGFPGKGKGGRTIWHLLPAPGIKGQGRFLGSIEDERRLFYVAVTRSQKHLHLTGAVHKNNRLYKEPSIFWNDVLEIKICEAPTSGLFEKKARQTYA